MVHFSSISLPRIFYSTCPRPAVLSQFNILIAQYETLLGEMRLRGDWLKKQLVVPSSVFAERPELSMLNVICCTSTIGAKILMYLQKFPISCLGQNLSPLLKSWKLKRFEMPHMLEELPAMR